MNSPHRFKLDVFEGPLDLLLHLVKVNEMDIYDIEISSITAQYMEYVGAMKDLDLEIAGDYLLMAATLLNIKSRALLPRMEGAEEMSAEDEIDDLFSTKDLIRRLIEYRRFKELAASLRAKEEEASRHFVRANVVPVMAGPAPELGQQDIRTLFDAFARLLRRPREVKEHHVVSEQYSVEGKTEEIRERFRTTKQINASRLFEACVSREEGVCLLLAILEMARMREITLAQAGNFEDILIEPWDDKVVSVG